MGWKSTTRDEKEDILRRTGLHLSAAGGDPDHYVAGMLGLPFYPNGRLVKIAARNNLRKPFSYVLLPDEVILLDGGISRIKMCNTLAPLTINNTNIHGYLKFFYYYATDSLVFESNVRRSAVGFTGKIWLFERKCFFETDINVSDRGIVTELEKTPVPDLPDFEPGEFIL